MWIVEYTVKGAYTIRTKQCETSAEAERFAARWRRSNSTGDYLAWVSFQAGA